MTRDEIKQAVIMEMPTGELVGMLLGNGGIVDHAKLGLIDARWRALLKMAPQLFAVMLSARMVLEVNLEAIEANGPSKLANDLQGLIANIDIIEKMATGSIDS